MKGRVIICAKVVTLGKDSVDEIWRLRHELLEELGELSPGPGCSQLESATKQYYLSHINQDLLCWGMVRDGSLVATGSLCLFSRLPYLENLSGQEGYLFNIYTSPRFRKQGFAGAILDAILAEARRRQIPRLWLHSSPQGKSLYQSRGFRPKENELELFLL